MNNTVAMPHHGRNVKRIREIMGIEQDTLAIDLGLSQQSISLLEQRETLDAPTLEKVAKALKVPTEAIVNFNDQSAYNIIGNVVTTVNDNATGQLFQFNPIINPVEKWIEIIEENKKLYERLLQSEKDKVEMLQKLLEQK